MTIKITIPKILFLPLIILALGSCQTFPNIEEASKDEIAKIQPEADEITKELLMSLQTKVSQAMQSRGTEYAINVCKLQAIPLTEIVEKSTDKEVEIKRTSLKYRNPRNAPDEFEKQALIKYESLMASNDEIPPFYIQKINTKDSSFYYYYKPLTMKPLCLTCHGSEEMIGSEILTLIQERYPEDKATGYSEGDFRGLVRIKFSEL